MKSNTNVISVQIGKLHIMYSAHIYQVLFADKILR